MVTIEFTKEEAAETREMLKAVIEPLEWSIAKTGLGHREWREFLKKRRDFVDKLIKSLEKELTIEFNEDEAKESIAMLKEAITVLERSIAKTDVGHREFRQFLEKRRDLADELIKRIGK